MDDLKARLANRVQLTATVTRRTFARSRKPFGADVDYAQLVKIYGEAPDSFKGRYSPAECIGCERHRVEGSPDPKHISTSFAERQNLTMRMHMRRFTRLTNAFSKKVENHVHSLALFTTYYNFVRVHKTLRMSPAMAAGASDRLWDIGDIVALVEAAEAKPGKRGPYKARVAGLNPPQHVGRKPDRKQRLGLVVANPDRDVARRRVSFRQRVSEVYAFLPSLFGIRKVSSLFIAGPLAVVPANVKPKVGHGHRMPRPKPRRNYLSYKDAQFQKTRLPSEGLT
jgi:hypothetical protein